MRIRTAAGMLAAFLWVGAGMNQSTPASGARPTPGPDVLGEGEELVYEVTWTFVKLGTVRLVVHPDYSARAWIDSYEGLPYVDLHSRYTSQMDSTLYSRGSSSLELNADGTWVGLNYRYDFGRNLLAIEKVRQQDPDGIPAERIPGDTLSIDRLQFVDGLSIAYLPRRLVHMDRSVDVPTVLHGKLGTTSFFLPAEKTTVDLDAVEYPVRAVEVDGVTTVVGVFGMTGDFRGWFSDDASAVPLKGTLKVLLGSVTIELIKWNKKGWTPPR